MRKQNEQVEINMALNSDGRSDMESYLGKKVAILEDTMYRIELEWRGWYFSIEEDKQIFGKTKVIAERGDLEEVFYTTSEYLNEELCEAWYEDYLYMYGEEY